MRNPLIRQAASDVEAARGNMIQAGLSQSARRLPVRRHQYGFNRRLPGRRDRSDNRHRRQAAARQGVGRGRSARRGTGVEPARYDLATQVRSNYLGVLVARERIKVNSALVQFADRVYRMQAKRVAAGQAAAYEPLQLRVLAVQAQTQLIQSNHDYVAAWRKLAITLNCPDMPPTVLAGRIDGPVPLISYEAARDRILQTHTDLVTAKIAVARAQYQLQLARLTPICPNIDTNTVIEHDYTTPPFNTAISLQVGVPIPSSTTTAATSSPPRLR